VLIIHDLSLAIYRDRQREIEEAVARARLTTRSTGSLLERVRRVLRPQPARPRTHQRPSASRSELTA